MYEKCTGRVHWKDMSKYIYMIIFLADFFFSLIHPRFQLILYGELYTVGLSYREAVERKTLAPSDKIGRSSPVGFHKSCAFI